MEFIKAVLNLFSVGYVLFLLFMASPFGAFRIVDRMDRHEPCYEVIVLYSLAIPFMVTLEILKYCF